MKLSIIVPCYNEEGTIGEVLKRVLALQVPCDIEVLVVDDGSSDRSVEAVRQFSAVRLIRHQTNRGKAESIRTGISESSGDVVLVQDADLEYFPEDIPKLLEPICHGKADVVIGSRFLGKPEGMRRSHLLANRVLSYVTQVLYGEKITDLMTGYKMFTRASLDQIVLNSMGFDIEAELVANFLKRRLRVVEIPIRYEYRKKGRAKITWKDGFSSLFTLLKIKYREYWQKIGGASLPIFLLSFLGYIFFAYRDHLRGDFVTLNGDEPHYLITTKSIVQDRDLFLENNYANPLPEIGKWPYDWHVVWSGNHAYSSHGIGLPVLMAPFYMMGGIFATKILMCLLQSLVNVYVYRLCMKSVPRQGLSIATSLIFGFATVLLAYSNLLFPEVPMALIVLFCCDFATRSLDRLHLTVMGLLAGFAPFLKSAYVVCSVVVFMYVAMMFRRNKNLRDFLSFSFPFFMMIGLDALYQYYAFGNPLVTPQSFSLGNPLIGASGIMLDRLYGLLVYAPVIYLSLLGIKSFMRIRKSYAIYVTALFLSLYAVSSSWATWWGGWGPPGRLIVPVIPLLCLPFVCSFNHYYSNRWFRIVLVIASSVGFVTNVAIAWFHAFPRARTIMVSLVIESLERIVGGNAGYLLPDFVQGLHPLSWIVVIVFLSVSLIILVDDDLKKWISRRIACKTGFC